MGYRFWSGSPETVSGIELDRSRDSLFVRDRSGRKYGRIRNAGNSDDFLGLLRICKGEEDTLLTRGIRNGGTGFTLEIYFGFICTLEWLTLLDEMPDPWQLKCGLNLLFGPNEGEELIVVVPGV